MKKSVYLPDYNLVAFPEYWERPASKRPQTLQEVCAILLPLPGIRGIWEVTASDARTGEILERNIFKNSITDNGAGYAIGNLFASSGAAYSPMNVMCISADAGSTALTTALTAGTPPGSATLAVSALPAAIPANTTLKLDYSTGSEESCVTTAGASAAATSITGITAVGGGTFTPAFSHAIGKTVVPVAAVTDNPSGTPTGGTYLSLVSGDFGAVTFTTGIGNRNRTITKKFPGASTTAATYTQARLANANPIVTGAVGAACIVPQAVINSTTDQTFIIIIKL